MITIDHQKSSSENSLINMKSLEDPILIEESPLISNRYKITFAEPKDSPPKLEYKHSPCQIQEYYLKDNKFEKPQKPIKSAKEKEVEFKKKQQNDVDNNNEMFGGMSPYESCASDGELKKLITAHKLSSKTSSASEGSSSGKRECRIMKVPDNPHFNSNDISPVIVTTRTAVPISHSRNTSDPQQSERKVPENPQWQEPNEVNEENEKEETENSLSSYAIPKLNLYKTTLRHETLEKASLPQHSNEYKNSILLLSDSNPSTNLNQLSKLKSSKTMENTSKEAYSNEEEGIESISMRNIYTIDQLEEIYKASDSSIEGQKRTSDVIQGEIEEQARNSSQGVEKWDIKGRLSYLARDDLSEKQKKDSLNESSQLLELNASDSIFQSIELRPISAQITNPNTNTNTNSNSCVMSGIYDTDNSLKYSIESFKNKLLCSSSRLLRASLNGSNNLKDISNLILSVQNH